MSYEKKISGVTDKINKFLMMSPPPGKMIVTGNILWKDSVVDGEAIWLPINKFATQKLSQLDITRFF